MMMSKLLLDAAPNSTVDYRNCICDGSGSSVPDMVKTPPLHSHFEDDEDDSLSSSLRSVDLSRHRPSTPRSIFPRYWSSHPSPKISVGENITSDVDDAHVDGDHEEDDVLTRLHTVAAAVHKFAPVSNTLEPKGSWNDAPLKCRQAPPSPVSRRQILPTPPPTTVISSSLLQPRRPAPTLPRAALRRQARSTPALLGHPHGRRASCLRPARYSCPALAPATPATPVRGGRTGARLHRGLRNDGRVALAKSVSFYAEVSVFEFVPPDPGRSQKGWSRYFAE